MVAVGGLRASAAVRARLRTREAGRCLARSREFVLRLAVQRFPVRAESLCRKPPPPPVEGTYWRSARRDDAAPRVETRRAGRAAGAAQRAREPRGVDDAMPRRRRRAIPPRERPRARRDDERLGVLLPTRRRRRLSAPGRGVARRGGGARGSRGSAVARRVRPQTRGEEVAVERVGSDGRGGERSARAHCGGEGVASTRGDAGAAPRVARAVPRHVQTRGPGVHEERLAAIQRRRRRRRTIGVPRAAGGDGAVREGSDVRRLAVPPARGRDATRQRLAGRGLLRRRARKGVGDAAATAAAAADAADARGGAVGAVPGTRTRAAAAAAVSVSRGRIRVLRIRIRPAAAAAAAAARREPVRGVLQRGERRRDVRRRRGRSDHRGGV